MTRAPFFVDGKNPRPRARHFRSIVRGSVLAVSFFAWSSLAPLAAPAPIPDSAPGDFEGAVLGVLKRHPELVRESLAEMDRRDEAARTATNRERIEALSKAIYDTAGSTVLGDPDGDVTVVVFLDYHCPSCRRIDPVLQSVLDKDPKVRILIKQLPILGPGSRAAALLMLANGQNAKTLRLHRALMQAPSLDEPILSDIRKHFGAPLAAPQGAEAALAAVQSLSMQLGIQGTPAVLVGDTLLPGAVDESAIANLVAAERLSRLTVASANSPSTKGP